MIFKLKLAVIQKGMQTHLSLCLQSGRGNFELDNFEDMTLHLEYLLL